MHHTTGDRQVLQNVVTSITTSEPAIYTWSKITLGGLSVVLGQDASCMNIIAEVDQ